MTENAVSQHVTQIDEAQKIRSEHNRQALAEVEAIKAEGAELQGKHVGNVNKQMRLLAENNRENKDFVGKFGNMGAEQLDLRRQVSEIEYIVRMLNKQLS